MDPIGRWLHCTGLFDRDRNPYQFLTTRTMGLLSGKPVSHTQCFAADRTLKLRGHDPVHV